MKRLAFAALVALALAGCKPGETPEEAAAHAAEAPLRTFLAQFQRPEGDKHQLSQQLQPAPEDYDAVFEGAAADKARRAYATAWSSGKFTLQVRPDQTDLQIFKVTTEELRAGAPAAKAFPSGYARVAPVLKPGLTLYAFRFSKPGEPTGPVFDGLIFVNGHWAFFPKPFHALR